MSKKLTSNVHVMIDPETGEQKWFGPDYPENGDPPAGSVTNEAAYAEDPAASRLAFTESDLLATGVVDGSGDGVDAGGMLDHSLREQDDMVTVAEPVATAEKRARGRAAAKGDTADQTTD